MHAQLTGFGGFVFGILILAMVPMYIATTMLVSRGKIKPIKIQIPSFWKRIPDDMVPAPEKVPETKTDTKSDIAPTNDTTEKEPEKNQKIMPGELREAFIRARQNIKPTPKSNVDLSNAAETPAPMQSAIPEAIAAPTQIPSIIPAPTPTPMTAAPATDSGIMPIPNDFDIPDEMPFPFNNAAPMFSDVTFGPASDDEVSPTPSATKNENIPDYLTTHGHEIISTENDIIRTKTHAIAVHDDDEFWVADDGVWFATGRQKKSPITELIATRDTYGVQLVLYLKSSNIMDIDNLCSQWNTDGIMVVTDINDIPPAE